ncbi:uncharacterized protein LOC131428979 [Malaya genurostris]|uniref:uncharacterized protein LOC131428979 n=1 Tax=Malaya genurostris TaxID=325434 RepID=UPI0026F3BAC0|nr:uncharacterized protein LOC131428979 [Malaya genurostris]
MAERNPGQPGQPRDVSEAVLQILANQQSLMQQMSRQLVETQNAVQGLSHNQIVLDSLSSNMVEFVFDKDNDHTFDAWFSRYADISEIEMPPDWMTPPKYHCFQTTKEDSDDYLAYSCKVNKACVDFRLSELTEEQFKCLIFVSGLKSKDDAEIRMRLINKLNGAADLTLQQVVEQCNSLVNLKQDTVLVENSTSSVNQRQSGTATDTLLGMRRNACFSSKTSTSKQNNNQSNKNNTKRNPPSKTVTVQKVSEGRKFVQLHVNIVPLRLQLDTRSDISIISHRSWIKLGRPKAKPAVCSA